MQYYDTNSGSLSNMDKIVNSAEFYKILSIIIVKSLILASSTHKWIALLSWKGHYYYNEPDEDGLENTACLRDFDELIFNI